MKHFSGQLLLEHCTRLDLSCEELGVMSGRSASSIRRYQRGESVPDIDAAVSIAQALGEPVTALLADTEPPANEPRTISDLPVWAQRMIVGQRDNRRHPASTRRPRTNQVSAA